MAVKHSQNRIPRPPVVVVMGHIDHGKSTFLDYVRKTNVVANEAGGITQHVGAYQVEHVSAEGKKHAVTFLDTPGHEAFCGIRERGARAADVAILVVSAEDGAKPQTIEALKAIKKEKIPYIVAINKIDKPNADINRAKKSLGENEIYLEGWGGDIPCVAISALNGAGVPELLEMVILVSELAGLTFDPAKPAEGFVIESERDSRRGVSATLLIKDGTLKTGTFVVAGNAFAPVRYIENFKGEKIHFATASMPVRIVGWNEIPACGIPFATVATKKAAERIIELNTASTKSSAAMPTGRQAPVEAATSVNLAKPTKTLRRAEEGAALLRAREANMSAGAPDNLSNNEAVEEPNIVTLPLIIKADMVGSLEGVKHELAKIKHDKVEIKVVAEGIGDINENDVKTAMSDPEIIIVGFNANPDKKAAAMIERRPINMKNFSVIYELSEFVRSALLAKVPREFIEEVTGRAKILAIFSKEKDRQVIGGKVETGILSSGNEVKITRRDAEIGRGKIRELQEKKVRTNEVAEGHEFGVMVEAKTEIAVGDRIEAVKMIEKT